LTDAAVSKSTLDKFWAQKPIKHEAFLAICAAVGVDDWQKVVTAENLSLENSQKPEIEKFNDRKIAKQIFDWLTALRYEFEAYEDLQPEYCDWIIRIPIRRGRFDRILIRGIESEAKVLDLLGLKTAVEQQQTDEGWLIVNRRISPAVRSELEKPENEHLSCMTFDELIDQDADFEPYLEWLEADVVRRGIDRKYVSLACVKEEIDPKTQYSIATSNYGEAEGWIEGYIQQWLSDDSKEHVSILGEFGTGKTWFAFHYAWDCLRAYKSAKEQGLERPRLPLVITLRDYNKALKVESVLSDLFFNKHDIRLNSSVFECLNRMGKLLLIFDGFDEMADKVDRQKMINNFWELARVVVPGAKVILTSRTEHFPHDRESRALLNAELESSTAGLKWKAPRFELLELAKFNEKQIRKVLVLEVEEKELDDEIVERVMAHSDLLELARRPVMMELIIEAMPDIEEGKPVDMSRVYYYAIVRKMNRDIKEERTFTSLADKLYFLCEVAWEMLSTEKMTLNYREFPDRIRKIFPQLVREVKDLDHWQYDMMGQTILIRNADGDYTPAHRSMLEFLVAYKFAAELGVLKVDFVEAMQQKTVSYIDITAKPQSYTWNGYLNEYVAAKYQNNKIPSLQKFTAESNEYLCCNFGYEVLTQAVIDLILPMLEATNSQGLLNLIRSTKGKTEQETRWLGGNAATLLVKQNPAALDCEDLSHTQMSNSNLIGANMQKVDFTMANLANSSIINVLASKVLSIYISKDGRFFFTKHIEHNSYRRDKFRIWEISNKECIYTGHLEHYGSPDKLKLHFGDILTSNGSLLDINEHLHFLSAMTSKVTALSEDGSYLLTCQASNLNNLNNSTNSTISIYHLDNTNNTYNCSNRLNFSDIDVKTIAISHNCHWFLTGISNPKEYEVEDKNTLKRWQTATCECICNYVGHTDSISALAIAPDDSWFISGSNDGTIKLWDILTGECYQTYIGNNGSVTTLAVSPNGSWFVSGNSNGTIQLWSIAKDSGCILTYKGHKSSIVAIAISPEDNWFISSGDDGLLKFWDRESGTCHTTYTTYQNSIRTLAIAKNTSWFITGNLDGTLKRWDLNSGKCLRIYNGHDPWMARRIAISHCNNWFVSSSDDYTLKRWDTETGKCLQFYTGHTNNVNAVAISSDERWIVSGSNDCSLRFWDVITSQCFLAFNGHTDWINVVAVAPDNSWVISGSDDNYLKRWRSDTGECLNSYHDHHGEVTSVSLSSCGHWFISGSYDNTIKQWDVSTGKCLRTYFGHYGSVTSVALSPDDRWFVSGGYDKTIKRWDVSTGTEIFAIKTNGHQDFINSLEISSDGCYIISCGGTEVRIWDAKTGECALIVSNNSCEGMKINGIKGLTSMQIQSLKALGAL
jgi:WD40 repeat protein